MFFSWQIIHGPLICSYVAILEYSLPSEQGEEMINSYKQKVCWIALKWIVKLLAGVVVYIFCVLLVVFANLASCLDNLGMGHIIHFSSVQLLSCIQLFATPWTAACQASLSITNSRSSLKLMSIESDILLGSLIFSFLSFVFFLWYSSLKAFLGRRGYHS